MTYPSNEIKQTDEEHPDAEIADVVVPPPTFMHDDDDAMAEEDVDTENTIDLITDTHNDKAWKKEYAAEGMQSVLQRMEDKARHSCHPLQRRLAPLWLRLKERVQCTKLYHRIMKTTRWHWIIGAIVFFSLYDLTLFFFGDKSYNIIYPKAEPLDGLLIEEKPKLIQPEVEEYDAPKPKVDKEEEETVEKLPDIDVEDTEFPTSVTSEPAPAPTPPKMQEIPKPVINPSAPSSHTEE